MDDGRGRPGRRGLGILLTQGRDALVSGRPKTPSKKDPPPSFSGGQKSVPKKDHTLPLLPPGEETPNSVPKKDHTLPLPPRGRRPLTPFYEKSVAKKDHTLPLLPPRGRRPLTLQGEEDPLLKYHMF